MIKKVKSKLRRSLGLDYIQERLEHLDRQNREIQDHNKLLERQLIDTLDSIDRILHSQKREFAQGMLDFIQPGSVVQCRINRVDILAPIDLLKVYQHCLMSGEEEHLSFRIETHCADWLCSNIDYGDVVFDIGAAFGVISLPLAQAVGKTGQVHAFEPARKTQGFLKQIVDLNQIENMVIVPAAISDQPGKAEFLEYISEKDFSWASDVSTLGTSHSNRDHQHESYSVDVTTIDDYVASLDIKPKAMKIDIEGFELYALHGAKQTLEKYLPSLFIDIHADVKTGKSSLLGVKPFLESLGYHLEVKEHTLFCTPNGVE